MKYLENQLKIYFYIFRCIGQFPFKITEEGITPSTTLKICGIVPTIALFCVNIYVASITFDQFPSARESILRLSFFLLGIGLLAGTIVLPILKSSLYCLMFQKFNRVEGYFHYLGISIAERKNAFPSFCILFKQLFIIAIVIATDFAFPYWAGFPTAAMLFYWMSVLVMTFVTINCQVYAHLLVTRYEAINKALENIEKNIATHKVVLPDKVLSSDFLNDLYRISDSTKAFSKLENPKNRITNLKKTKDVAANVRLLQKSHYELYGICSNLNSLFTFPIVITIFFTGAEILFTCYTSCGKILNEGDIDLFEILTWTKYIIYDIFRVLSICASFTNIERSGNTTPYIVHGLLLKMEDLDAQKELMKFSQQLLHQKINFSNCGFFRLDMSLLVSMSGAITTYVVILLQFSGKSGCEKT